MSSVPTYIEPEEILDLHNFHNVQMLTRELDRCKSKVFTSPKAAFMGPLMCGMDFRWTHSIPTAGTNGVTVWWNPEWFLELPPETRITVLIHELRHAAYLHITRRGERDHRIFNYACDIVINNELDDEGYSFEPTQPWMDHQYDGMNAEEIYEALKQQPPQCAPWGPGSAQEVDIYPGDQQQQQNAVNNVIQAAHTARMTGHAGDIPGEVELVLEKFLAPKVPWEIALQQFFTELGDNDRSWARPNRRYQHIYLPSENPNYNGLQHLIYYLDVSGSISDADIVRFNSEVKYIKDTFNPELLTLVQFDTIIQHEDQFTSNDDFEKIVVTGRGGTSLSPVYQHIVDNQPTAAIIFSDLYCAPMHTDPGCPIIWVVVDNKSAEVPFGKKIHIKGD